MKMLAEILVVDDDAHMRDLVVKVLTREGYSVRALPRGQDVLEAIEEAPVDLVVSDIRMPGMDGMTLLREVKRRAPETCILLMTAFGSIDSALQAIKEGAYDYLTKPFRMDEIICSAIPKELLERELFGHLKEAFTGAIANKRGLFEEADGSSLFLDEIGELSPELQVKLLRVIQERELKRVGDTRTIHVDVCLIAATNRDLIQAMKDGLFREDLYYRLNVIPIILPDLKDRVAEIPLLAMHFLMKYAKEANLTLAGISKAALRLLLEYDWPGNVRELENVIERAVILGHGSQILPEDLPVHLHIRKAAVSPATGYHRPTLEELGRDQPGGCHHQGQSQRKSPLCLHRRVKGEQDGGLIA